MQQIMLLKLFSASQIHPHNSCYKYDPSQIQQFQMW